MTAILRLQLDDKDPVRVNSAINQLAESYDRNARSRLTAATTFYVSTSGSNSNSGTSAASPFLTIQHAYDVLASTIDLGGNAVTIQCASGTYTTGLSIATAWTGGGSVTLDLGGGTISSSSSCLNVSCALPGLFAIKSGTLTCSSAFTNCISHVGSGIISLGSGMIFGAAAGAHMTAQGAGSEIQIFSPYTITGGATYHYLTFLAGNSIQGNSFAVTITGSLTINFFAYASRLGCINIAAVTYSAATTGTRYNVDTNAVIATGGGGANYFPGSIAGVSGTGGQYT